MPKLPAFVTHLERLEAEVSNLLKNEQKRKDQLSAKTNLLAIKPKPATNNDKSRSCSCTSNANNNQSKNSVKSKKKTKTTLIHQPCKCNSTSKSNDSNRNLNWSARMRTQVPNPQIGSVLTEFHKDISFNKGNKAVQICCKSYQTDKINQSRKIAERRMLAKSNSCPIKGMPSNLSENFNLFRQQRSLRLRSSSLGKRKCSCNLTKPIPYEMVASQLSNEMRKVKHSLQHICQCKNEAEHMTKNLKNDYKELVSNKRDLLQQISELCSANQSLNERCMKFHQVSIEKEKEAEKLLAVVRNCEGRIQDLENRSNCAANDIRETKLNFQKCLCEKDNIIASLQEKCACLEKKYTEKCKECENLNLDKGKLEAKLCETDGKYVSLAESNTRLCQCLKNWENELKEATKERDSNKILIDELKEQNASLISQLQDKMKDIRVFENQIASFRDIEQSLNEKVLELVDTISSLEEEVMKINKCNCDYKNLQANYERLNEKYKESTVKLEQCQKWADRCQKLEEECREQFEISSANEQLLMRERDQMRALVQELTLVVKQNKETLLELSQINRNQQEFIDSQNSELVNKTKEIECVSSEIETIRHSKEQLENELKQIKSIPSYAENIEQELSTKVRFSLNDNDKLRIKEQIINDQKDTISKLQICIQEKSLEIVKLNDQLSAAEDQLSSYHEELVAKINDLEIERYQKENMMKKIKKIDQEKHYLIKELNSIRSMLENESYCGSACPAAEYEKALLKLRYDFEEQKRRWCEQRTSMILEKEKAINAAQFATQKLLETVGDFQKQVTAQKHIQKMLTGLLQEKDILLKEAQSKILTISSISGNLNTATTSTQGNSVVCIPPSKLHLLQSTTDFEAIVREVNATTCDPSSFYQSCSTACSNISSNCCTATPTT